MTSTTLPAIIERPIIFSAPMIRALLDGRKSQTRRVVKPQPTACLGYLHPRDLKRDVAKGLAVRTDSDCAKYIAAKYRCPYGRVGDRLWVRENFEVCDTDHEDVGIGYFADDSEANASAAIWFKSQMAFASRGVQKYPSIYMPRWASRITLEITAIRVERVQSISASDCKSEGFQIPKTDCFSDANTHSKLKRQFEKLWDSINAKKCPWSSNPWVWVIEFQLAASVRGKDGGE